MKEFKTYLFIGFGLIGGSIARALRADNKDINIIAWVRHREKIEAALSDGTIDEIADTMTSALDKADAIFLCAPTGSNIDNLRTIAPLVREDTLITDVGSVKGDIQSVADELGIASHFLGGHPMTGRETTGYASSDAMILENAYYLLTPSEATKKEYTEAMTDLVKRIKSIPLLVSPSEHDYATAAISHVPHLIAATLVNTVKGADNEEGFMKTIAAGGFKDITRIASSDPAMWESICRSNTANIRRVLKLYSDELKRIDTVLENGDFDQISTLFKDSGSYRSSMSERRTSAIPRQYILYVDIPDEAGEIAMVATLLAASAISIKNIGIIHNREQAEGALGIVFHDETSMKAAIPVLQKHNYKVILT